MIVQSVKYSGSYEISKPFKLERIRIDSIASQNNKQYVSARMKVASKFSRWPKHISQVTLTSNQ